MGVINTFWHKQIDSRPLSRFRVLWGGFLIYYYIRLFWLLELYYVGGGLQSLVDHQSTRPTLQWSLFYVVENTGTAFYFLYGLTLCAAVSLLAGIGTGLSAIVLFLGSVSLLTPMSFGSNSADEVVKILSFLFMLVSVSGFADRRERPIRLRHRGSAGTQYEEELIPSWSLRIFQLQLCMIYLFSGLQKASKWDWWNGEALTYIVAQTDSWMRYDVSFLTEYQWAAAFMGIGVIVFEMVIFPVFVWFEKYRLRVLLLGVLFHLSIVSTMRVFIFTEVMLVFYACFLKESDFERVFDRVRQALRFRLIGSSP